MRVFEQKLTLVKKKQGFNLKVPLFVEKRQNKFAYDVKKNKFVNN